MYHKILAARQKMDALIPHLAFGGGFSGIMQGAGNVIANAPANTMGFIANPLGTTEGAISTAGEQLSSNLPNMGHAAHILTHPNPFNATAPGFASNMPMYTAGAGLGTNAFNQGIGTTAGEIGNLGQQAGYMNATGRQLNDVYAQQGTLAQALSDQARGIGPNPALEQYKQNVNANIAAQTGAAASQRGINPALAARMAAQGGAAANAGAAGTEATLQAEQELAARQQLAQQQAAMAGTLGEQAGIYGAAGNLYGAGGQLGQGITSAGNTMYGTNVGGIGTETGQGIEANLGAQKINAGVAAQNAAAQQALVSQGAGAISGGLGKLFGGGAGADAAGGAGGGLGAGQASAEGLPAVGAMAAHGGTIPDRKALSLASALRAQGGGVPGKAKIKGDDESNDTVPTVLSPGEIVLPRSVTQDPDAANKAAEFVEKLKGKAHPTYGKVLQARRKLADAMAAHQACGGMAS